MLMEQRWARLRMLATGEPYQRALRAVRSGPADPCTPLADGITAGSARDSLIVECPRCGRLALVNGRHASITVHSRLMPVGGEWFCYCCFAVLGTGDVFPKEPRR